MDIKINPGTYVIAVSGGVDSVVLLELASRQPGVKLVVAHYDHGIRPDSGQDRVLVQKLAEKLQLPFQYEEGKLGPEASEAVAREARYAFLRRVREKYHADALMTAHHQDDVLETIIINWLRGTGSRGLSSLRSTEEIVRPLLTVSKQDIRTYAKNHDFTWREDSTNSDTTYLRNHVRLHIISKMSGEDRKRLLATSTRAEALHAEIDPLVQAYLASQPDTMVLNRDEYRELPVEVASEVLVQWLRKNTDVTISRQLVRRLHGAILTGRNSSQVDVARGWSLKLLREQVILVKNTSGTTDREE